jgi:hypothetical protein
VPKTNFHHFRDTTNQVWLRNWKSPALPAFGWQFRCMTHQWRLFPLWHSIPEAGTVATDQRDLKI